MTSQTTPERSRRAIAIRSMASWDLWVSLLLGIAMGIVWSLVDYDAQWGLMLSAALVSLTVGGIAWTQRNQLRGNLKGTNYGRLLRTTDPEEGEAMAPYTIVLYVALTAFAWSAITLLYIEVVDDRNLQAVLIGITAFLVAWAVLGLVSLVIISGQHDRMAARVEHMKEDLDADRHAAKTRRRDPPNTHTGREGGA